MVTPSIENPSDQAAEVAAILRTRRQTVATAESCTGGLIAKLLTDIPGSSAWFLAGVVAYANSSKSSLLGVSVELIQKFGAVSGQVAESMAAGCRSRCASDWAVAVTGIAGPDGGTPEKPVGLVWVAVAGPPGCQTISTAFDPTLSRAQIRERAAHRALQLLRQCLLPN